MLSRLSYAALLSCIEYVPVVEDVEFVDTASDHMQSILRQFLQSTASIRKCNEQCTLGLVLLGRLLETRF